MTVLKGITRRSRSRLPQNPAIHSPLALQNRVIVECHGPDKVKQRVEHVGNVLCTWGLNKLIEELSAGSDGFATDWVNRAVIATGTDDLTSNLDSLTGSTDSPAVLGGGSMVASDAGARTLQYNCTFDDAEAYTAGSIGLFGSTNNAASMVAAKTFTEVSKQSADTIYVSYQIIAGTA